MSRLNPVILLGTDTTTRFDKTDVDRALRDLAHATRGMYADVTLGAQMIGARSFNVRVIDGRQRGVQARFLLRVWIGTEIGGAPGGTQTATVTKGTLVHEITAGRILEVMTNERGEASIDVDGAAGTRGCHVVVMGLVAGLDGAWT